MTNQVKIQDNLKGLVGFNQPFNIEYQKFDSDNILSRSGLFVTDNPLIKGEMIVDSQDYSDISDVYFNSWIVQKLNATYTEVMSAVFNKPDFIYSGYVFNSPRNKTTTETLPNGFVGYELTTGNCQNKGYNISNILLEFEGSGDVELLLFSSENPTTLENKIITIATGLHSEILNWTLKPNQKYFLGYLTSYANLGTLKPYARSYENSSLKTQINSLEVDEISISWHATNTLFDLNDITYISDCVGLNPNISVYNDFTDFVISNENLFARAIQLSSQISFMREYMATIRSNGNERKAEDMVNKIRVEIDGIDRDGYKKRGLTSLLADSIIEIQKEIEKLNTNFFGDGIYVETVDV